MKILVTGGAGFIGSHVVKRLLDKNYKVIVYDNLSRGFRKLVDKRAFFIKGSVLEKKKLTNALKGVDAVVHMAGFIVVPESIKKPKLYWKNNVEGSKTLLEAMKIAGVNKIVFSSSATVYGNSRKLPLTEKSPIKKALNPYGATKIEIERMIREENKKGWLSATILRYFNPYGPNELHKPETHAIPNFIKAVFLKKPIPLYWEGEQVRDFIYVEDLAEAHIKAINLEGFNIFNIGTGKGTKVIDVVNNIFKIVGYKVPIKNLGKRKGDAQSLYTSNKKIKKELNWKPKFNLEKGLRETINWFKKEYNFK